MSESNAQFPRIGFVTTCRGRLHHIQRTLPLIVAERPDEITVVDHDCPQGTGAWVESNYPDVKVLYIKDGAPFNVSRARNVGIRASAADVLCVIDADVLVAPGFVSWIRQKAGERTFFRQATDNGRRLTETWGTFVSPRLLLLEIGLFDEVFDGWGGEDNDIYYRLKAAGSIEKSFPLSFVTAISHGADQRFAPYQQKDKRFHLLVNDLYMAAKRILLAQVWPVKDVPLEVRQQVWREIKRSVIALDKQTVIRIRVNWEAGAPPPYRVDTTVTIEMKVDRMLAESRTP